MPDHSMPIFHDAKLQNSATDVDFFVDKDAELLKRLEESEVDRAARLEIIDALVAQRDALERQRDALERQRDALEHKIGVIRRFVPWRLVPTPIKRIVVRSLRL
jgi:hypothetical protein